MRIKIQKIFLIYPLLLISQIVYCQSSYYFPQIDTLILIGFDTPTYLNIYIKNDTSRIDTIVLSAGWNTHLQYIDSSHNYQYVDYYCYSIPDSSHKNTYEVWYSPVDSDFDTLRYQISMNEENEIFLFEGYFYLTLFVNRDSALVDSLSQLFNLIRCLKIDIDSRNPFGFVLLQNYPNPFNPITTISYQLPKSSFIKLAIYDVNGKLIETLVNDYKNAGYYSVEWNADKICSGIYFYRIDAGEYICVKKCLVIK